MKIRTAIFGVYVAASAAGFAVLMFFVLKEVRPRYVESMRRTLNDTACVLAGIMENDLQRRPQVDFAAAWADQEGVLAGTTGALRIYATDARGHVIGETTGGGGGTEVSVIAPVRVKGRVLGFVGVARSLSSATEAIWHARVRLITGALAVACIMLAAGWWIATRLTGSIERLTAHVLAVRDGKGGVRPPASRASEVAALAQAFEEMRVALEGKAYVERYTEALTHELKAPLSAIRGAAELLQESMPAEERARFLAHLRVESERIQIIVDRMLQLAALEARHGLEGAESVNVGACVREAVEALRAAWRSREVEVRIEGTDTAQVRGEKFLLGQAVTNLLSNAIEFSPVKGVVVVRLDGNAPGWVRVVIEDQGPGVPEFARERIFERFYSLPRPATGRKSTGLGLSFVREIALLHGGEVAVGNRAEGGTRAVLILPSL